MKSATYARLALLLPYLTLIESIGYFIYNDLDTKNETILQSANFFWNFFAFFWFVPYTILAIYLLIRSRGKTIEQVRSIYMSAPFTLMFVAPLTYIAIMIIGSLSDETFIRGLGQILIFATIASAPASLIIGYIFVTISLLFYKGLQKIKFIRN